MRLGGFLSVLAACLLTVLLAIAAFAQHPAGDDPQRRAGYPLAISPWALPSDTGGYVGYLVGGGAAHYGKADLPLPTDGTWGWDYAGHWFPRRVILLWWHGRRYQGGTGAYQTDGPQVLHPLGAADRHVPPHN